MLTSKWAFLLLLVMASCSKKNTPTPLPALPADPIKGKLARLSYDTGAYDSLYYGSAGELIRVKSVWDPALGGGMSYVFDYNAQGKLTSIQTSQAQEYRYIYTGNELTEVILYINGVKTNHKNFTYDNNGVMVSSHTYADVLNAPGDQDFLDMFIYTYYPDGNLKTETAYSVHPVTGHPVKETTITYTDYDDRYNPDDIFKQMPYYFGFTFAKNNARLRSVKNEKTGELSNYVFTYTYNQTAKPVSRKFEFLGNGNWYEGICTYAYYQ